jgi:hypothetical protein
MTTQLSSQVSRIRRCKNGHTFSTCESFDSLIEKDTRKYNSSNRKRSKEEKAQKIDLTIQHISGTPAEKRLTVLEMLI